MQNRLLAGLLIGGLLVVGNISSAAELTDENKAADQLISNDQSYFSANFEKQPQEDGSTQKIQNHFTFFTINVVINGKLKEDK